MEIEKKENSYILKFNNQQVEAQNNYSTLEVLTLLQNFLDKDLRELNHLRAMQEKRKKCTKEYYLRNKEQLCQRSKERYKNLKGEKTEK